jgi:Leucine-rich repeat (LRR) protein
MSHTLASLKSGSLIGLTRLKMSCGLTEFPKEILELKETLEVLDLSDNQLSELPKGISMLKNLKIIFFANNNFKTFPRILASLPSLTMIGFKSNVIDFVPENSFPKKLRWLVLTNNKIKQLPKSIGACHLLQKCALAGNLLKELPIEMSNCRNLELLRVSANQLISIPSWLVELPKLSWVAFNGNPAARKAATISDLASYDWNDFSVEDLLGEGASGVISKATWKTKNEEIAIKVFKGTVTSDGLPDDEMEISIAAGQHDNLVQVLGKIKNHPELKSGLIMKLISKNYLNLGNPPSLDSCTRDTFSEGAMFSDSQLLRIATSIASVCVQLHAKGINHGDLYAHNIMINETADCLLGDFGAASMYDVNKELAHSIERVEIRAFGCLLEDVFTLVKEKSELNGVYAEEREGKWQNLITTCLSADVKSRPNFAEVLEILTTF